MATARSRSVELFDLFVVFIASGSVLVLEILAGRMLAPYVGVSLQSYTGAIGAILAGISLGAWVGGRLADRLDAGRLPALLLVAGGALSLCTVPAVRFLGERTDSWGWSANPRIIVLCLVIFLPPAAVLSAVTPCIVKTALRDLEYSGSVIGRYSAVGTAGALAGTFATGFIFIAAWPVPNIVFAVSAAVIALGLAKATVSGAVLPKLLPVIVVLGLLGAGSTALSSSRCEYYTTYFCARILPGAGPNERRLVLDDATHSVIDVNHPERLISNYAQQIGDVIATMPPGPLRVLVIGAGGMALPRHLAAVRPGTHTTVLEIDPVLVDLVEHTYLDGLPDGVDVKIGDARVTVRDFDPATFDVVIGDAFSTLTVPWHLTTVEFIEELERVLRPDGLYLMNLIEFHRGRFLRSEAATLARSFRHVSTVGQVDRERGVAPGNIVLLASDSKPSPALTDLNLPIGDGGAVLTDAKSPVDQWFDNP